MRWWLPALGFLVGCNKLFDLEHVSHRADADTRIDDGGDGGGSGDKDGSTGADAIPGCPALELDEDGDGLDDRCDGCPTSTSTKTDTDLDGLPDACDPSDSTADEIERVWTFGMNDTADLVLTNATWNSLGNGALQLGTSAKVVTSNQFLPTWIEVNVRGAAPGSSSSKLVVALPAIVACEVQASSCTPGADNTCAIVVPSPNTGAQLGTAISSLRRINFFDQTGARCQIRNSNAVVTANGNAAFAPSTIEITTSSDLSVFVDSIVIYGAK